MTDLLSDVHAREAIAVNEQREGEQAATVRIVVDTSVLIADPHCVKSFAGRALIIPLTVIEELDSLKTRPDDVGR